MENRIQPILCCVGAEVVGEPTQFLMERAASAAHWDWHVITVEVAPADLPKAWDGMVVMRFTAARFFQAHQAAAMHLVGRPSVADLFIGGITSAMRVGDQWSMWHNRGPALLDLFQARVAWKESVLWLHGNSPQHRSLLSACLALPPKRILWTGSGLTRQHAALSTGATDAVASLPSVSAVPASTDHTLLPDAPTSVMPVASSTESAAVAASSEATPLPTSAASHRDWTATLPEGWAQRLPLDIWSPEPGAVKRDGELSDWLAQGLSQAGAAQAIVHAGDVEPRHLDALAALQPESACDLLIVSNIPGARRKLTDLWRAGNLTVLSSADVVVADEAYDLARWTGQSVNLEVLREAYDEYADF